MDSAGLLQFHVKPYFWEMASEYFWEKLAQCPVILQVGFSPVGWLLLVLKKDEGLSGVLVGGGQIRIIATATKTVQAPTAEKQNINVPTPGDNKTKI